MTSTQSSIFTPARLDAPDGCDRHSGAESFCNHLAAVLSGRAASALLDAGLDEGDYGLFELPSWSWAEPAIPLGRKALARDGGTLRMPVRISWDMGPVVLVPAGSEVTVRWDATGLGRKGTASTVLATTPSAGSMSASDLPGLDGPIPSRVHAMVIPSTRARRELERLVEAGTTAWWELLSEIEGFARQEVGSAAGRVAADIAGHDHVVLDPVALDAIVDSMMFGAEGEKGQAGQGRVIAMLERAMRPHEFKAVEPTRWLRMTLARDAEAEVRRAIGDPHIGRKVRSMARELGPEKVADLEEFLRVYADRYPGDGLAVRRAADALTAMAEPLMAADHLEVLYSELPDQDSSFDNTAALEHIEASRRSRRRG